MGSSRREFLKRGTWMALAAGVPWGLAEKVSAIGITATSLESGLSLAAFKAQINTTFVINDQGFEVKVKLIDVTNLASAAETSAGKEGFSLLFQGSEDTFLKQDTYVIKHEVLGVFSFLLVPIKFRNKRAPYYEAVINRLYP